VLGLAAHGDRGRERLLPVLCDRSDLRRVADAGAADAGRDRGYAAARLHGAVARLRNAQPLGQAPDRSRGGSRCMTPGPEDLPPANLPMESAPADSTS